MQRHIFLFLHLIIFISSSLGFFRVARCPSFSGTILRFEGMSHLLLKIFLFTALLSTVGFLRVASQGRAAGEEMINYCNTVKKKITHIHQHLTSATLRINSAGMIIVKGEPPDLHLGLGNSFTRPLRRRRVGRKKFMEGFLDWPQEHLPLPFSWRVT